MLGFEAVGPWALGTGLVGWQGPRHGKQGHRSGGRGAAPEAANYKLHDLQGMLKTPFGSFGLNLTSNSVSSVILLSLESLSSISCCLARLRGLKIYEVQAKVSR